MVGNRYKDAITNHNTNVMVKRDQHRGDYEKTQMGSSIEIHINYSTKNMGTALRPTVQFHLAHDQS